MLKHFCLIRDKLVFLILLQINHCYTHFPENTSSTFQGYLFFHVTMVTDATKCWTQFWVYIAININKIFWKTCITQPFLTVNDSNTYFAPSQHTVTNPILESKLYHRSWKTTYHFNLFLTLITSSIHKRMWQQILCRRSFLMNTFKCQS